MTRLVTPVATNRRTSNSRSVRVAPSLGPAGGDGRRRAGRDAQPLVDGPGGVQLERCRVFVAQLTAGQAEQRATAGQPVGNAEALPDSAGAAQRA
jgi:hypothetical protein